MCTKCKNEITKQLYWEKLPEVERQFSAICASCDYLTTRSMRLNKTLYPVWCSERNCQHTEWNDEITPVLEWHLKEARMNQITWCIGRKIGDLVHWIKWRLL